MISDRDKPVTPARLRQIMRLTDHGKKDIYDVALACHEALEAWVKYSKNVQPSLAADYYSDAVRLTKTAGLWPEG